MDHDAILELMRTDLKVAGFDPGEYFGWPDALRLNLYSGKYGKLLKHKFRECSYVFKLASLITERYYVDEEMPGNVLETQIDARASLNNITGEDWINWLFERPSAEAFMAAMALKYEEQ